MKPFLLCALLGLAACNSGDWRPGEIAKAEEKMRDEVGDQSAEFLHVQITGDESTGQICGEVKAKPGTRARFIVYIDGTDGPFVEHEMGRLHVAADRFNLAWRYDCVREGYKRI